MPSTSLDVMFNKQEKFKKYQKLYLWNGDKNEKIKEIYKNEIIFVSLECCIHKNM